MKFVASVVAATLVAGSAVAGGYTAPIVESAPVVEVVTPVAVASAWDGFYAGLQYGQGKVKASGELGSASNDFDAYGLHGGYLRDMGKYVLGGELDYNKVDVDGLDDKGDLVRLRGRVGADLGRFMPYVTLGAAHLSLADVSETAFTYGVGVDFAATEKFSVGAEVTKQDFNDVDDFGTDLDTHMVQVRASYHF